MGETSKKTPCVMAQPLDYQETKAKQIGSNRALGHDQLVVF
jgi:hypothetical protein